MVESRETEREGQWIAQTIRVVALESVSLENLKGSDDSR
jgi:hypothetical protein